MKKWKYYDPLFQCDNLNSDMLKYAPWSGHRNFVYDLVSAFEPAVIAELGSHYGCSAFTFAQAVKDRGLDTAMYFVDTWEGDDFTKKYDNDVYTVFLKTVNEFYSDININMLRMTFDEAVGKFEDGSVDLLHIDGSHYYDDVKRDFESWLPKVSENGIIMLHDVSSDIVLGDEMGSHKFWLELKKEYKYTFEFDFSWGLGLIFMDKGMYKAFKDEVKPSRYQRINNALDTEYKDQLRKNYFRLKDDEIYINDLLKQKDVLTVHLDAYKKNAEEKDRYINDLEQQRKRDIEQVKRDIEQVKTDYEKTIDDYKNAMDNIVRENEKNSENALKDFENERKNIINAYEKDKKAVSDAYENEIENIKRDYNKTIKGKDKYIDELVAGMEELKKERDMYESKYKDSIEYKVAHIREKLKK